MATVFKKDEHVHHFDACGGDSFIPTVNEIIEYLKLHNYDRASNGRPSISATLKFNEHTVEIVQGSDVNKVWDEFKAMMNEASEKYRKSPEGIAQAAESAARLVQNQERMDAVMWQLTVHLNEDFPAQKRDGLTQPEGDLARNIWELLRIASDASDNRGVTWDKAEFIRMLHEFGYVRNQWAGADKLDEYNLETYRAYVAGQILDCLRPEAFGLIHPVTAVKIEQHGLNTNIFIP